MSDTEIVYRNMELTSAKSQPKREKLRARPREWCNSLVISTPA